MMTRPTSVARLHTNCNCVIRKKTNGNAHQKNSCRSHRLPRLLAKRGGVKWSKISRFAQCSDHLEGILGQSRLLAMIFRKNFRAGAHLDTATKGKSRRKQHEAGKPREPAAGTAAPRSAGILACGFWQRPAANLLAVSRCALCCAMQGGILDIFGGMDLPRAKKIVPSNLVAAVIGGQKSPERQYS